MQQYVNGQQKMKTEENANLLKEPYEDLSRKEIRLVDKEDEEIILSIPNLHPPAVTSLAYAVFVKRKTYLHLSREKPPPPPLYCHFLSYLSQLS